MLDLTYPIVPADVETLASCLACGAGASVDIAEAATEAGVTFLTTGVCRECGLIYRRRRPHLHWFETMWRRRDAAQKQSQHVPFNAEVERTRYDRYARTAELLRRHDCGSRVLDVGCGPPTGLKAFVDSGFQTTGIEPDRSRAEYAPLPQAEIAMLPLEQFVAEARPAFDAVTCQHSLEHLPDPRQALLHIAALTSTDGLVYLEVPDWREDVRDWNDALYLAHTVNFVEETLVSLAGSAGLQLVTRTHPPADREGSSHLACLFRKMERGPRPDVRQPSPEAWIKEVRAVYRRGLEAAEGIADDAVLRFVVPYINDLSMTIKGDPQTVLAKVFENFAPRLARFDDALRAFRILTSQPG